MFIRDWGPGVWWPATGDTAAVIGSQQQGGTSGGPLHRNSPADRLANRGKLVPAGIAVAPMPTAYKNKNSSFLSVIILI